MSQTVCRKVARRGKDKVYPSNSPEIDDGSRLSGKDVVDWAGMPDDIVIKFFSCLNYRDRANLSSTCRSWRRIGWLPCLWQSLDLRTYTFDDSIASLLAPRCNNLQKLHFRGEESVAALQNLKAPLHEISGDNCWGDTDASLSVIASHKELESLQLGPEFCAMVSSSALQVLSDHCPKLQKLRLSGIREVDGVAINALAIKCQNLTDICLLDCHYVDTEALGNIASVRFLSVAGTSNIKWSLVSGHFINLPNLECLDVSRTDIVHTAVFQLLSSSQSLRVMCALDCPKLKNNDVSPKINKGKILITLYTDIFKDLASLYGNATMKERNVYSSWRNLDNKNKNLNEMMTWLEWILTHSLLHMARSSQLGLNNYWLNQGVALLLSLSQSSQEDVQERAASALGSLVVVDEEFADIDGELCEAVIRGGGILLLLHLAKSWREGLQLQATMVIANLSVITEVAKVVAEEGGISILVDLARSMSRSIAQEAARGLENLSVWGELTDAVADAGGVQALVDLILRADDGDGVLLKQAAKALIPLAASDKISMLIAEAGGLKALVSLVRNCNHPGVQEQAARALSILASHADSNSVSASIGQEVGALEALIQLLHSFHDGVRKEAAAALSNLSVDDGNRGAIAAAGGVETLVALAKSRTCTSHGLRKRVAGALWGLSVSEANSISIGREGGIARLITFSSSRNKGLHESATGALWFLALHPSAALEIVEGGGLVVLLYLCSTSVSKIGRFMAAMALAYIYDGRMDEFVLARASSVSRSTITSIQVFWSPAMKYIDDVIFTSFNAEALFDWSTASLTRVAESARILEAGQLRCSDAIIGRIVAMLRNPSTVLKTCAAFALLQFTVPGDRHALRHSSILQSIGATRVLRAVAAAKVGDELIPSKKFAKVVLGNLEYHRERSTS